MNKPTRILLIFTGVSLLAAAVVWREVLAEPAPGPSAQASPIHPAFALLDANGENVLASAAPLSTMQTCGQCHDADFIVSHSYHADVGLSDYSPSPESWNASPGMFGQWNPLTYRYLSQESDERLDLSTAEWIMLYGERFASGGPAESSRSGEPLSSLIPSASNPESSYLDPDTGNAQAWNWASSGTIEMNCFLCHAAKPNNDARLKAIRAGDFDLANTATLFGSGIVSQLNSSLVWNENAFDANGELKAEYLAVQDPTDQNCSFCHGVVHTEVDVPLVLAGCTWETGTTGQIITAQRVSDSGMNISAKEDQTRSWDVHAEKGLMCTDCHYALNNPAHAATTTADGPQHLLYDPRTLEIGEYLEKPDHNIARGQSAQYNSSPELKGSMRRCDACHDARQSHAGWLPYIDTHMNAVACETCHIPKMYAPAIQTYDWTVIKLNGKPASECRGIEMKTGSTLTASTDLVPPTVSNLVTGFEPVLLDRANLDGTQMLAPYNLITSYYWVYTDANGNQRPVRLIDLETVFTNDGKYLPEILAAFDANADGALSDAELVVDSQAKEKLIEAQLLALGLNEPHIEGLVEPYSINHDVTRGEWALNDCQACHTNNSRLNQPIKLADYAPNGILPHFADGTNVMDSGRITTAADGALYYQPQPAAEKLYIFGGSRVGWVDGFGAIFFVLTLAVVAGHGTLRYLNGIRKPKGKKPVERVYMYQAYERFWHWLQTTTIVILLFTGLIIHRPDVFGLFSFRGVVIVHNVLAAILAINALLSLFYHLTTGQVRQYLPRPYGFFDDAIEQAKYYLVGIFKGRPHPFAKTPDKKLNPLQQATYFGILVVLLPLQGLTGILMWGVQKWPQVAGWFGGLPVLAPAHTLIAWLFAAFIVGHVYLTTTGATPFESIRGMVTGFEQVEVHE